jgi:SAM-dependent methyltransferase
MHTNSRLLFARYAAPLFYSGAKVLEIGPDGFPSSYRRLVSASDLAWHTLDICDNAKLTHPRSPPYAFPIPDGCYDIVLAGNVIEHVKRIWLWTKELARVCAPGGKIILLAPVSWPYHPSPVDCWRIYPDGMEALLQDAGLEVIECRFESLERTGFPQYTPGMSPECQSKALRWFHRLGGCFGFPVERSYDTVAIAAKPLRGVPRSTRP